MKEPSLQRKLKIARRDDVIGFPQLSNPSILLSLLHTQTHTYTCACTHTHMHTISQPQIHIDKCGQAHTHPYTLSHREGRLLSPRATEAGKPAECVCRECVPVLA